MSEFVLIPWRNCFSYFYGFCFFLKFNTLKRDIFCSHKLSFIVPNHTPNSYLSLVHVYCNIRIYFQPSNRRFFPLDIGSIAPSSRLTLLLICFILVVKEYPCLIHDLLVSYNFVIPNFLISCFLDFLACHNKTIAYFIIHFPEVVFSSLSKRAAYIHMYTPDIVPTCYSYLEVNKKMTSIFIPSRA